MNPATKERIERIISNLQPATALQGKFGGPASLPERMKYHQTPGVSIAVIDNFKIDWAQGFGVRDVRSNYTVSNGKSTNSRITTETVFQAGSISKAIFALAVLRLMQNGQLDLDEDVNSYLTSWRIDPHMGWQPRITLRQLLSHTAGLTVHGFPGYQAGQNIPTLPQILNGEWPANTNKVQVNILPGTQFRYSGGGTTVAQQVVVDVIKRPFPQIMHELVFEPLGMTHTTFAQPLPKRWAKNAATGHLWNVIPVKGKYHTYPEMAAAGLWTTATDLAKVGVELLKVLQAKTFSGLLSQELIESMLVPQLKHQVVGEGEFVGLGFFCNGKEEDFCFGHSGQDQGFFADMQFYKALGKGAVIMTNFNEGGTLIREIRRAIANEYSWPGQVSADKQPVELADIQNYIGRYVTKAGLQFLVTAAKECLTLVYECQSPLSIYPASPVEFFTPALNGVVRFEFDNSPQASALVIHQNGNLLKAYRAESSSGLEP